MTSDQLSEITSFLNAIVKARLDIHFQQAESVEINARHYSLFDDSLADLLRTYEATVEEYITLLLAIIPHLQPNFFDAILQEYLPQGGDFPEFGGVRGQHHRGILPTGETALFILAGNDLVKRLALYDLFSPSHFFAKEQIMYLEEVNAGEPRLSGRLILNTDYVELFTTGTISPPQYGSHFPAQQLETDLVWDDVILPAETLRQIQDIENWITHYPTLRKDEHMKRYLKPGYRALFYGPPGTGKTLTATLLGKYTSRAVFRVDLSLVVSKYIGETEKNLGHLFDKAQSKNWILFFDEADALFGKRTETRDAHDRYANQEVAYLLQKIEEFDGLVILASNLKSNIDPAFARRFQTIVHYPIPTMQERLLLWEKYNPVSIPFSPTVSLKELADRYELTGAGIVNVIQLSVLRSLGMNQATIASTTLLEAIRLEYQKEGKLIG